MTNRDEAHRRQRHAQAGGFSLIEVLFAVLLLTVAAGGLMRAVAQSSRARQAAAHSGLATRVARAKLEELLAAPFSRAWPRSGYHPVVTPGGGIRTGDSGVPGYFAYVGEDGEPSGRAEAFYEVRWRVRELVPPGEDRLASLGFEVVAMPVGRGGGPVVRLESVRVANRE